MGIGDPSKSHFGGRGAFKKQFFFFNQYILLDAFYLHKIIQLRTTQFMLAELRSTNYTNYLAAAALLLSWSTCLQP